MNFFLIAQGVLVNKVPNISELMTGQGSNVVFEKCGALYKFRTDENLAFEVEQICNFLDWSHLFNRLQFVYFQDCFKSFINGLYCEFLFLKIPAWLSCWFNVLFAHWFDYSTHGLFNLKLLDWLNHFLRILVVWPSKAGKVDFAEKITEKAGFLILWGFLFWPMRLWNHMVFKILEQEW